MGPNPYGAIRGVHSYARNIVDTEITRSAGDKPPPYGSGVNLIPCDQRYDPQ